MDKKSDKFVNNILEWFKQNKRDFAWRNIDDPYRILISEILLRKTTSTHVNSLYHKFFEQYPNIKSLSNANSNELNELVTPLGLANQRTNQILKLSKAINADFEGEIPDKFENLLNLPGVGKYTAGAVMCIAFNQDEAMVDTNAVRVISRYFSFKSTKKEPYTDPILWDFVKKLIPKGKCKQFNLGIIDFAHMVCLPRIPKCPKCPLNKDCDFFKNISFS